MAEIKASRKMKAKKKKSEIKDPAVADLAAKAEKAMENIAKLPKGDVPNEDLPEPGKYRTAPGEEPPAPKGEIVYRKQTKPAESNIIDERAYNDELGQKLVHKMRMDKEMQLQSEINEALGITEKEMPKAKRKMKVRRKK
jgi:hypothetical protein